MSYEIEFQIIYECIGFIIFLHKLLDTIVILPSNNIVIGITTITGEL